MGFLRFVKNWIRHDANLRHMLNEERKSVNDLKAAFDKIRIQQKIDYLRDKTLNSKELGISNEKYADCEIIVSLTSFGKRIYDVHLAIESIMQGTLKPNRIVLWLSEQEFGGKTLPKTLELQQKRGLDIRFCEDIRSYTKLIPALKTFPGACIITIDDDLMYEYDIVERLVDSHRNNPKDICACRIHKITFDEIGKLESYLNWKWGVDEYGDASSLYFPTGVGGVLYPPHCMPDEVFKKDVFMEICPYADDVWFYAMGLLKGTKVTHTYTTMPGGYFLNLPSSAIDALSARNTNESDCYNDVQIKAVFEKYNLYERIIM